MGIHLKLNGDEADFGNTAEARNFTAAWAMLTALCGQGDVACFAHL
jgi:hypothetical protein